MAGQPIKCKALINVDLGEAVRHDTQSKETLTDMYLVWKLYLWS